jgi:Zn-dependent M28 family amino/carboxypeptidase
VARIPGQSPDRILLLAHFDTLATSPGANDGASGAAVLLELARQLAERPLPYTTELVFLDNEMAVDEKQPTEPLLQGSRLLADHLRDTGAFDAVRLAVFLRQVGDAELTVGRDLLSNRIFREAFFDAAHELGLSAAFPADRGFVEVDSSHRTFVRAGMPRVVSLMDPWYGGEEPPGAYWGGEADTSEHCAPESLRTVGVVTLAALRQISGRLERIDSISGRAARLRAEASEAAEAETTEVPGPAEAFAPEDPEAQEGGSEPAPAAVPEASPAPGDGPIATPPAPEAPPESS